MQDYIFDLRKRPLKEKGRLKLYCNFEAQPIFAIRYSIILVVRADFVIDYAQDNMGIQYEQHLYKYISWVFSSLLEIVMLIWLDLTFQNWFSNRARFQESGMFYMQRYEHHISRQMSNIWQMYICRNFYYVWYMLCSQNRSLSLPLLA